MNNATYNEIINQNFKRLKILSGFEIQIKWILDKIRWEMTYFEESTHFYLNLRQK